MVQLFLYLHVLSAIFMGFYLLLPFLSQRLSALSGDKQQGFLHVLFAMNRAGQWAIWVAFISGGYLVSKNPYSMAWIVLAIVLFLAIGALTGIMGKRMRLSLYSDSGSKIGQYIGSIKTLSIVNGVLYFLIVTLMKFPMYS